MTTLLAQLTDLHIREPGRLAYGRIDTAPYLREAVDSVLRLRQMPDAVVITGDLCDFGRPTEYAHLAGLLAPLPMPVYLLPGNHDDRRQLRASFPPMPTSATASSSSTRCASVTCACSRWTPSSRAAATGSCADGGWTGWPGSWSCTATSRW